MNEDVETILSSLNQKEISYQDKNVLITGGAGFIGSWICDVLIKQGANVLYERIIKLHQKDMVYLIKPKSLRYWLKSIALRDATDVFADLASSGY